MLYLVLQHSFPLRPGAQYTLLAAELPLLSRLNERWHFKSINWDRRQTSLNVSALSWLRRSPPCNLASSTSPLLKGRQLQIESLLWWLVNNTEKKRIAMVRSKAPITKKKKTAKMIVWKTTFQSIMVKKAVVMEKCFCELTNWNLQFSLLAFD